MRGRFVTITTLLAVTAGCGGSTVDGTDTIMDTVADAAPDIVEINDAISTWDATEVVPDALGEPELPASYSFVEYPWMIVPPDLGHRLCPWSDNPEAAPDKVFIECEMEGESFSATDGSPDDEVLVMAYNIERGKHVDGFISLLLEDPAVPVPDILLLSEADRGCSRSGTRHVTRDLAKALGMNYVFAVEFVELNEACEHGNAVLSRYPLGNVRQIRHATNLSWYAPPGTAGQPRLGGRIAVYADVNVGGTIVHVYSLHLESDVDHTYRTEQAREIAEDGLTRPYTVIPGGDLNTGVYFLDIQSGEPVDPTALEFTARGYQDAHWGLPYDDRITSPDHGFVLDLVMGLNATFSDPAVCPGSKCDHLSDHRPIWTTVGL